jgi:hypothetical protein
MDGALFKVFLGRSLRSSTRKIFLIVDRLPAHEDGTVANWVEAHKDRIALFPMPPHTPELNPDEYLNNDLKGNVNEAGLPANKEELRSRVQRFMRQLFLCAEACHELLPRRERISYEPEARASGFRRGPAIHSLALRACMMTFFLAGVILSASLCTVCCWYMI